MDSEYRNKKRREYYYRNKELEKERRIKWREENPEKFKESQKQSSKKHYENNKQERNKKVSERRSQDPCARILNASYGNAKTRGIKHSIGIEDVRKVYPKDNKCPILGVIFTNIKQEQSDSKVGTNPSLDRIDSKLGYTPENIWVISWQANKMKSDATKEELIAFSKGILKLYGEDTRL